MWLYMYMHILLYILSLLRLVFFTFRGWNRLSMLWFVGQQHPVNVTLRAVLIYFVRFVVIFLTLFSVVLMLWVKLFFCFLFLIINCGFFVNCCVVAAGVPSVSLTHSLTILQLTNTAIISVNIK
jgi:hypothetical protein